MRNAPPVNNATYELRKEPTIRNKSEEKSEATTKILCAVEHKQSLELPQGWYKTDPASLRSWEASRNVFKLFSAEAQGDFVFYLAFSFNFKHLTHILGYNK